MTADLLESPSSPVEVANVRLVRADELAPYRDAWNALAAGNPFRSFEWLDSWRRHFARESAIKALAAFDSAGSLVGLAPMSTGGWDGRRWSAWGGGLVCSDYQSLLVRPGGETEIAARLAQWLEETAGDWTSLSFDGVPQGDAAMEAFVAELALRGAKTRWRPHIHCWRTALSETWDAFVMRFTKRRRTTVRQLYRKCFEEGQVEVRLVESPEELREAWPILVDLHQRRQRAIGNRGCFSTPQFAAFLWEVAERFLSQGRLRLQWLAIGGRPASAHFDLVGDDAQYHYLSGMDPNLQEERPGRLGTLAMIHRALHEGIRVYDFLRGDHRYKSDWLAEPIPIGEWRIAAPGLRGSLELAGWSAWWRARRMAKRIARRHHE